MTDTTALNDVYNTTVNSNVQEPSKDVLKQTQQQVNELVEILHDNYDKAMKRENKLSHLTEISQNLENNANEFKTQTIGLKRKEWWRHMKTRLVFAGLGALVLLIIIALLYTHVL